MPQGRIQTLLQTQPGAHLQPECELERAGECWGCWAHPDLPSCLAACTEAYSSAEEQFGCMTGCRKQLPEVESRKEKVRAGEMGSPHLTHPAWLWCHQDLFLYQASSPKGLRAGGDRG